METMFCAAWISSGAVILLLVVGLLLFGGRLPDVAKDIGRLFLRARRTLDDIRRESGIDETLRELDRESREVRKVSTSLHEAALPKPGEILPKPESFLPKLDPVQGPFDPGISRGQPGDKPHDDADDEESRTESDEP
jgi:Sec-independent protein translocase protein TatA